QRSTGRRPPGDRSAASDSQRPCPPMRIPLVVRRWWAGPALIVLLALLPAPVSAQPGWYYLPELTLSETFDDNVFGASSRRESDFVTRLSSGVKVGYRSTPLTFLLTSPFDP